LRVEILVRRAKVVVVVERREELNSSHLDVIEKPDEMAWME
jgi:hypothetical protein